MTTKNQADRSADFDPQGGTARPGGQAEGGIDPHPGDPASPQQSEPADGAARRAMRDLGFGDDKGGEF